MTLSGKRAILFLSLPLLAGALFVLSPYFAPADEEEGKDPDIAKADKLYREQNYKDAADVYAAYVEKHPDGEDSWHASTQVIQCKLALALYGEAQTDAEKLVERSKGRSLIEARAERVLGGLFLQLPHWGTEQGGEFKRGEYGQGEYVVTFRLDQKHAVEHFERARALYDELASDRTKIPEKSTAGFDVERVDAIFELVQAIVRFGPYDSTWGYYWYAWADEADDSGTVGEEEKSPWGRRGNWGWDMGTPRGIPVDLEGNPIFEPEPDAYASDLTPTRKMKYLLSEIGRIDPTETRDHAARALFLRAMLARARYGPDRLQGWAGWWSGGIYPYQKAVETAKLWELADDQALTLLATRIAVVSLPADEDVLALLRRVVAEYPDAKMAPEAAYAIGLHYQSRQQYEKALAAYADLAAKWPEHERVSSAASQKATILAEEAKIGSVGVELAGTPAVVPLTYRNITRVEIAAYRLDVLRFIEDEKKAIKEAKPDQWYGGRLQQMNYYLLVDGEYKKYQGEEAGRWTVELEDAGGRRYADKKATIGLTDRGAYLLEARIGDRTVSRNILLLSDLAILRKNVKGENLYWVVDARTGAPQAEAKLDLFSYWGEWNGSAYVQRYVETPGRTDANGTYLYPTSDPNRGAQTIAIATAGDRVAFSGVEYWSSYYSPSAPYQGVRTLVVTDRPVYRPGDTVRVQFWARRMTNGVYDSYAGGGPSIHYRIRDPKGNVLSENTVAGDRFGGAETSLSLSGEAALGMYGLEVEVDGTWSEVGGNQFRVEEYKKPEFEVKVEAGTGLARLGEKFKAKIEARYYFGAPVTEATVTYKVYREDYDHRFTAPGPWDWLYGAGYGRCWYAFDWFGWWGEWGCRPWFWYPWWGPEPTRERELVQEGEARIGPEGTLEIEVDSAKAAADYPDRDHRYTVEAEVRDMSRRVIQGSGEILLTRHDFFANLESDRGWYRPGEEIAVQVFTVDPMGNPVSAQGMVTLSRVEYRGADLAKLLETPVESWEAKTDEDGRLDFKVAAGASGQYSIQFATVDSKGGEILGTAIVWVCGDDFDGTIHRFNSLEIITDKRTYAPGETAYLMVNAARAGSTVLFADGVDGGTITNYRFLTLPAKSLVVPVKIEKGSVPNFFVEATLVSDGKVFQEVREIVVPPTEGMVEISVEPDKKEYKPGEEGTLVVRTTTPDGKPVSAQVAIAAYDRSVLYIQPEITPDPRAYFWGQKRWHSPQLATSLAYLFQSYESLAYPDRQVYVGGVPEGWSGFFQDRLQQGGGLGASFGDEAKAGSAAPGPAGAPAAEEGRADRREADGSANGERAKKDGGEKGQADGKPGAPPPAYKEATVRKDFADTAFWKALATTDEEGKTTVRFKYPENLTTWRVRVHGMTEAVRVGSASTETVTTKKLLVRLQAPRFFVEKDQVTLSANVHNYLDTAKKVKVSISVTKERMSEPEDATREIEVEANGEKRVDWTVTVLSEGEATIQVSALTDEESDAMEMKFPVLVHGMEKMVALTGILRPQGGDVSVAKFTVPQERRPEASRLEVRFSPTLAGAMLDALPYLLDYPYGCTEQTLSRFVPAVQVRKFLARQGVSLQELAERHAALNPGELGDPKERVTRQWGIAGVFRDEVMNDIIAAGLDRIRSFQHGDGGWGWWQDGESSVYITAHVLDALLDARDADLDIPDDVLQRGLAYLQGRVVTDAKEWEEKPWLANDQVFSAYVLARMKAPNQELDKLLFEHRANLSVYGKGLLSMALRLAGEKENADVALQNMNQYLERDPENQTAWYRTPEAGWWYWWNNDVESAAIGLEALLLANPADERAPELVKWLLANRRNGYYWRSTRDTARVVSAFYEFLRATKEDESDYSLSIRVDGREVKKVTITPRDLLALDNSVVLTGDALAGGEHTLEFVREGKGAVYWNAYLSYFTLEEDIPAAGLEIKVDRTYFLLKRVEYVEKVTGARGQEVEEKRVRYEKVALKTGDAVDSGDVILVELMIESKNDYDYLVFEDMKPAGCEPVALTSGASYGELVANMELRDEKVAFFIGWLSQGKHKVEYRLRAEVPGVFHALPTKAWAMYAPELKANADEVRLGIRDR
ncbi:MAG: hypothetical protein HY720_08185 [Planctomycetes bacterium]|nr:hypothetical protein [Planctomycetota bacterium]